MHSPWPGRRVCTECGALSARKQLLRLPITLLQEPPGVVIEQPCPLPPPSAVAVWRMLGGDWVAVPAVCHLRRLNTVALRGD
jgi:hypothetical protein